VWIASSRSLSSGAHSRDPLAPLRKRFAFVAGNDGQDTARTEISFKSLKIYSLKPALKPPVARLNGNAVNSKTDGVVV
jgi:hypothetical protein